RRDDEGGLDSVLEKVEEVVLAAQGLSEVTTAIQELSELVHQNRKTTLVLTTVQECEGYLHLSSLQRTVSLGEFQSGKLVTSRMVVIKFTEQEATVPIMTAKVKDALGINDPVILTDHNAVEILDSEGTRGSFYWKQNSRKIMAVLEADFQAMKQKRRRISRRDDEGGLDSVLEKVEEVVLAAQGLSEVTTAIQELSDLVHQNRETTLVLTEEQSRNDSWKIRYSQHAVKA
ncbi:uncharacterized protein LOC107677942, partial [Sinocyclocheilus anshuiensis]|uniref:uncharacterized protein LOC107677942 n=1 Tax=Sinocyclocheilus anshuiensis TaxID=1608454 RepID=UPI0007B8AB69